MKKRLSHGKETVYENTPAKTQCDVPNTDLPRSPAARKDQVQYPFPFDRLHECLDRLPFQELERFRLPACVAAYLPAVDQATSWLRAPPVSRALFADRGRRRTNKSTVALLGLLLLAAARIWSLQAQLAELAQPRECEEASAELGILRARVEQFAEASQRKCPDVVPLGPVVPPLPPLQNVSIQGALVRDLQNQLHAKTYMHEECMSEFETHLNTLLEQYRKDLHDTSDMPMNLLTYAGAVEERLKDMGVH